MEFLYKYNRIKLLLSLIVLCLPFISKAGCDIKIEGNFCVLPGSVEDYKMEEHTNYSDNGACTKWEVWGGEIIQYGAWTTPTQIAAQWYDGHWIVSDCSFNGGTNGAVNGYAGITVKWNNDTGIKHIKLRASGVGVLGLCGDEYTEESVLTSLPIVANIISANDPKACNNLGFSYSAQYVNGAVYLWQLPSGWTSSAQKINFLGEIFYATTDNSISGIGRNGGGQVRLITVPSTGFCGGTPSAVRNVAPFSSPLYLTVGSSPSTAMINNYIYVCNGGTTKLNANVTGGTPPYTYTWSPELNSPSSNPACWWNCSTVDISANNVSQGSLVTVTVTDAKGCEISNTMTVAYGDQRWMNSSFFTNFNSQQQVLTELNANYDEVPVKGENIIIERVGNPYYVGADGNIWMYKFQTSPYTGWANIKLTNLVAGQKATGELAIYEPSWGNRTIYFRTENSVIKALNALDYNSLPVNLSDVVNGNANGEFTVDNSNNLFFIGSGNKIYKSSNPTVPLSNNVVEGINILASGNRIYYIGKNGSDNVLKCMDYNGANISINGYCILMPNTKLDTDGNGNVYFVGIDKGIYYVSPYNVISGLWQSPGCNGNFSINKSSGVIYYGGVDNNIYQAYNQYYTWNTKQLINTNESPYDIHFANPNVFYINKDNYIKLIWYPTGFCNPNVLKTSASNSGDHLDEVISMPTEVNEIGETASASPNPFSSTTVINYTLKETSDVKIVVSEMTGREIAVVADENNKGAGVYNVEFNASTLSKGIYLANVIVNGRKLPAVKLVVQ